MDKPSSWAAPLLVRILTLSVLGKDATIDMCSKLKCKWATTRLSTLHVVPELGNASLCLWERQFMPTLPQQGQAIYQSWWPSLTEDHMTIMICVGVVDRYEVHN